MSPLKKHFVVGEVMSSSQAPTNLVDVRGVSFARGNRQIFDNISLTVPKGKVTAIMGPSGIGKTTLLRLIGGQLQPTAGEIWFNGENIPQLSRSRLYDVRKKMSMLFQSGALFTDLNVYDNVAWPLREHTRLPEPLLHSTVMMKLEAVGLRGAAQLKPSELSGGMARRAALARAIALEPDLIMFDEPFVGQDPITMGVLVKLIDELNHALGVTCIVVSHDVPEVLSIADYAYIVAGQKIIAQGSTQQLQDNEDARVRQFIDGIADGPVPFRFPAGDYLADLTDSGR
ncbi:putative ABC transport system, ATP-binding protein yrbF [Duffyella gerundensis]|jgi:phospholipid/cholesterol/gamma-HCH transport system ATP-binding protein|uniref:Intermembrane phospholipid transport system ATP-binding protein MlaF n=2 Tax=Erwiniaceae TaxID=1903409 RepID=A0A0U5GHW9_9GAMM|nr:putative ABC transport system, ATP-binding protein yrbF [Duffyella gerundensis]